MRRLNVYIEIQGKQNYVGVIAGESSEDARFTYGKEYSTNPMCHPISIHLPFREEAFSIEETRNFFEGLLPEGFTRRCVAGWVHADEGDYLTLLAVLGKECLGAIQIIEEGEDIPDAGYQRLKMEQVQQTAKNLGIEVPDSFVVNVGKGRDEDILFATRRYDRILSDNAERVDGFVVPYRLHQEDFSQAMGIAAIHKYERNHSGYLKQMFEILRQHSSDPIMDQLKLWDICVFNYLIGNTDNHIKNVSLLYGADMLSIRLAPAYDIVSTVIYSGSTTDMAFSVGREYDIYKINRECFRQEAVNVGLGERIAMQHYDRMADRIEIALDSACAMLMNQGFEQAEDIKKRIVQARRGINYQ